MQWINWINIKDQKPNKEEYVFVLQFSTNPILSTPETIDPDIRVARWIEDYGFLDANDQLMHSNFWYPLPNQPERSKREDCDRCTKLQEPINGCCYTEISQMRCSEHCGNTVRDK